MDPWWEGVERTSVDGVEGGCWTTPSLQWHNCLSTCVHVNGGHFEHKFWTVTLWCFVCSINTGSCKFDWYKHVQSASIAWNVLLLCLRLLRGMVATKRMCGRKFLLCVFWHTPVRCARHLRHVATLHWEIKSSNFLQIFSRYGRKRKQIAF